MSVCICFVCVYVCVFAYIHTPSIYKLYSMSRFSSIFFFTKEAIIINQTNMVMEELNAKLREADERMLATQQDSQILKEKVLYID